MPFMVGRNANVNDQIKALADAAAGLGLSQTFRDAVLKIVDALTNRPLEFGDPEYRTKFVDGVICHGVYQPLLVRYAVFETAQIVQILEIKAFPGSALAR
jgi:hypothetical protein